MGPVCSMESKATLPILVRRAGREWQRLNFAALGKGKIVARFRKKKAPDLHTSLRNPPRASPVLSSGPQRKQQENCSINIKNSQQYRYRPYLYLSGPITTTKKVPQQPQPETSSCPTNQPRNTCRSEKYIT